MKKYKKYTVESTMNNKAFTLFADSKQQAKELAKAYIANKFYFGSDLVLADVSLEYDMNHKIA